MRRASKGADLAVAEASCHWQLGKDIARDAYIAVGTPNNPLPLPRQAKSNPISGVSSPY